MQGESACVATVQRQLLNKGSEHDQRDALTALGVATGELLLGDYVVSSTCCIVSPEEHAHCIVMQLVEGLTSVCVAAEVQ